jgi:hypothetical protein
MASYAIYVTTWAAGDQREAQDMAKKPPRLTDEMLEYHPSKLSAEEALARVKKMSGIVELTAPMPPLKRLLGIPSRPRLDRQSSKKTTADGVQGDPPPGRRRKSDASGQEGMAMQEKPGQRTIDLVEFHPRKVKPEDAVARIEELAGSIKLTAPMPPLKRLLGIAPLPRLTRKSSKRARD